jgi:hypothetical protein
MLGHATGGGAGFCVELRGVRYTFIKKLTISKLLTYHSVYMEDNLNYYARNKEARKAYQRQYYKNNREKIKTKRKYDELSNPDLKKARQDYNANYYKNHKSRLQERRRELYKIKKPL